MFGTAIFCETLLEGDHFGSEDELGAIDDAGYCGVDLPLDLPVLIF
jgi:hypothetical protein